MSDVYLPLPYTPNDPREEPRVLFKLGSIYQDLELGQEYDLKNPVSIFSGTYFPVMVTGFYQGLILVQSPIRNILNQAVISFFSSHHLQDYKPLSQEEYCFLYPQECQLLPGRVLGIDIVSTT
ncbi:MAG: hypothetical protein V7K94_10630 [Nostoc sp.]|uniref:hypothetical protein n=1 Tax=Nostoc sp. TaxID=1180 RepID=UPI002FF77208